MGVCRLTALAGRLRELVVDRTPASRMDRLLGGDFVQVGFIRRNAVTALGALGRCDAALRDALTVAMSDPYWEVRAAAAQAAQLCGRSAQHRPALLARIVDLLADRQFEVVLAALRGVGELAASASSQSPSCSE